MLVSFLTHHLRQIGKLERTIWQGVLDFEPGIHYRLRIPWQVTGIQPQWYNPVKQSQDRPEGIY
jgi:hypothetical protein